MKKLLVIGIGAVAVVSLWLVFAFSHDSSVASASLATPAYAGGPGIDSCTDLVLVRRDYRHVSASLVTVLSDGIVREAQIVQHQPVLLPRSVVHLGSDMDWRCIV